MDIKTKVKKDQYGPDDISEVLEILNEMKTIIQELENRISKMEK